VFSLNTAGHWELTEFGPGGTVDLPAVEVSLLMADLYEGWSAT
jgi:hypothetical protein